MPRTARDHTRSGPAIPPNDNAPDTGKAACQQVLRTAAGAAPMPAAPGTPRSVFDTVPKSAAVAVAPVIHRNKPIPEPRTGKASVYLEVYDSMAVGDCAEYPDRQAAAMCSALQKRELPHLVRRLSAGTKGIWRTAGIVAGLDLSNKTRKAA
jgi:hypothetical protein